MKSRPARSIGVAPRGEKTKKKTKKRPKKKDDFLLIDDYRFRAAFAERSGGVRGEEKESALVRARDGETRCLRGGCVFGREGEKEGRERRDVK